MAARDSSRFWRRCRIGFRRFRMCTWLVILALSAFPALPEPDRAAGVCEEAACCRNCRARHRPPVHPSALAARRMGSSPKTCISAARTSPSSPKLTIEEVEVDLDYRALAKLAISGAIPDSAKRFAGLAHQLDEHTPAHPVRQQHPNRILSPARRPLGTQSFRSPVRRRGLPAHGDPHQRLDVRGWKWFHAADARVPPGSAAGRTRSSESGSRRRRCSPSTCAATPPTWLDSTSGETRRRGRRHALGSISTGRGSTQLNPSGSNNALASAEVSLQAETPDALGGRDTNMSLRCASSRPRPTRGLSRLISTSRRIEWKPSGEARRSPTCRPNGLTRSPNAIPLSGRGRLEVGRSETRWGSADGVQVTADLSPPDRNAVPPGEEVSGWWTNLAPYAFAWECRLTGCAPRAGSRGACLRRTVELTRSECHAHRRPPLQRNAECRGASRRLHPKARIHRHIRF